MEIISEPFVGAAVFKLKKFEDDRGYFTETYNQILWSRNLGMRKVMQDNMSFSKYKDTLRGIHFQNKPFQLTKVVRCLMGSVIDYMIDLRKDSPTYLKYFSIELTPQNEYNVLVPHGFGHALYITCNNTTVQYKMDGVYNAEADRNILWNDPALDIEWPSVKPFLSPKDQTAPLLKDCDINL